MHIPLEKPVSDDLDAALNNPAKDQIDIRDSEEPLETTNGNHFLKRCYLFPIPLFCTYLYPKK